jgi:hypothetical protein
MKSLVSNNFDKKETEEMIEASVDYLAEKKSEIINNTSFNLSENKWIIKLLSEHLKLNIILLNDKKEEYIGNSNWNYIVLHYINKGGIQQVEFVCRREKMSEEKIEKIKDYQTIFTYEEIIGVF